MFPSFRLTRNPFDPVNIPKIIDERDITKYYSISTQTRDLLLSKLQKTKMKKHYKNIPNQAFEITYDQKLQTITVVCNRYKTAMNQVLHFLHALDEELEDYKEPLSLIETIQEDLLVKDSEIIPNSIKIYNAISLVNINDTSINCLVCWAKLDYATETLLFECCTGYTHLDHGLDWLKGKQKCPKCGKENPFTLQLPSISIK